METTFEFSGGALCLDFANTIGDRAQGRNEKLNHPSDLASWAREAKILRLFPGLATGDARFLRRGIATRERIYRVFSALSAGESPRDEDLEALNRDLATALGAMRIRETKGSYEWGWEARGDRPDQMLWPVLRSAANLLTSEDLPRVKECASETCTWLFIDRSRTHRRRWCDMSSCGNRAKARRHYLRKQDQKQD